MHSLLLLTTALSTLAGLATAQINAIPACAFNCFKSAVSNSGCNLGDYVCQCSDPAHTKITADVTSCLCQSGCSQIDLGHAQTAANKLCQMALSANGQTYTPTMYGLTACGRAATGGDLTWNAAVPTRGPRSRSYEKAMIGLAGVAAFVV